MSTGPFLDDLLDRALKLYPQASDVCLVGSRAYGAYREQSDYDVVVYTDATTGHSLQWKGETKLMFHLLPASRKHILWHGFLLPKVSLMTGDTFDHSLADILAYITWKFNIDHTWVEYRDSKHPAIKLHLYELQSRR